MLGQRAKSKLGWLQRSRAGLRMSAIQFLALEWMLEQRDAGWRHVDLGWLNPRTVSAMEQFDWICPSRGLDGVRHSITSRGERAYGVFRREDDRRFDGVCPECGKKPRAYTSTGKILGYCRECNRRIMRRRARRYKGHARLCPRCGEHEVHRTPSGRHRSYCVQCEREYRREELQRRNADLRARIEAGEHVCCSRPGCDEPRYVYGERVCSWCHAHYREYHNQYQRQRSKQRREVG